MKLLIFPGICLYFLVGWLFSKIAGTEEEDDEFGTIAWFLCWPFMILILGIAIFISIIVEIYRAISRVCEIIINKM